MTAKFTKIFLIIFTVSLFSSVKTSHAFLGQSIGSGCPVVKLQGQWQHTAANMVWEFLDGGLLLCSGDCTFKKGGKPIAWQVERNAKTALSLEIYLSSEKVSTGCSMAARDRIMNLEAFGTFRRLESKP